MHTFEVIPSLNSPPFCSPYIQLHFTHTHTHTPHTHTHIHLTHTHIYIRHTYTHIHLTHTYTHIHLTHTHTHIHTLTYTHTHARTPLPQSYHDGQHMPRPKTLLHTIGSQLAKVTAAYGALSAAAQCSEKAPRVWKQWGCSWMTDYKVGGPGKCVCMCVCMCRVSFRTRVYSWNTPRTSSLRTRCQTCQIDSTYACIFACISVPERKYHVQFRKGWSQETDNRK